MPTFVCNKTRHTTSPRPRHCWESEGKQRNETAKETYEDSADRLVSNGWYICIPSHVAAGIAESRSSPYISISIFISKIEDQGHHILIVYGTPVWVLLPRHMSDICERNICMSKDYQRLEEIEAGHRLSEFFIPISIR